MTTFIFFALGAIAGSVANALIYRLPRSLSWTRGHSICPKCKHKLGFWDLVPVVSYLLLGGKCRYCKHPIPYRYLWVEVFLGLSFMVISGHSWSYHSLILSGMVWCMTVIAVMDWESMLVSDWLVGVWFVLTILNAQISMLSIYGLLIGVVIIGGIWILTKKKGMGAGDIGIAAVMGLMLGWPKVAIGLWLAFITGAVYGVWQLAIGKKKMKSQVPFGPFLILGTLIASIWGEKIIRLMFH